uniref:Uncharacterized protein n=1 Tax=Noctiluca scintillans TaxID=2966 RepID=A0A7S0ZXL2_NOCSC|mmetsp:Transcript_23308/g.61201  ORF Transcript_23308/g.61201 Transcript_23308/m.61201 type:complete len:100 (+) Transcript_23308:212-511(+)
MSVAEGLGSCHQLAVSGPRVGPRITFVAIVTRAKTENMACGHLLKPTRECRKHTSFRRPSMMSWSRDRVDTFSPVWHKLDKTGRGRMDEAQLLQEPQNI